MLSGGKYMGFNDNLNKYRKERGLSQEELAYQLGVSRQSVSKWESGQSIPELERIIEIADLFSISLDELVGRDYITTKQELNQEQLKKVIRDAHSYEYKSKITINQLPLVHINLGRGRRVAKGVIAIGNIAIGVFSLGCVALGFFSLGAISLGLLALGGVALGGICLGGLSIGYLALGGLAIGIYAFGGLAIGLKLAIGGGAIGNVAIGSVVKGNHTLVTTGLSAQEIVRFISIQDGLNSWIVDLIKIFG